MSILDAYKNIRKVLNSEVFNSINIEKDIELIIDVLDDWLDSYYNSRDFECLMRAIENDYLYTGKAYRGITLLKEDRPVMERLRFFELQSFSKDKKIALSFANNGKVTINNEINIDKELDEVTPILMELDCENVGIDLHKFANDMLSVCKSIIQDEDTYSDFETGLSYALEEEEVLFYPSILINNIEKIKIYEI